MVWVVSLSTTKLSPRRLTRWRRSTGIRGLVGCGKHDAPWPIQCPTPRGADQRLPLKAFRGEPAISGFDWHFTPIHSSSPGVAPPVGAGLHGALPPLHPGHG